MKHAWMSENLYMEHKSLTQKWDWQTEAKRQTQKERLTGRLTESGKETDTERETDRKTDRQRQRDRHRKRDWQEDWQTEAKRQTQKERLTGRLTDRGKETDTERETDRKTDRQRQRDRHRKRDWQEDWQTEAKRQTQKERLTGRLTDRGKETDTERETDRKTDRQRQRDRHRKRDWQEDWQRVARRQRQTGGQTEWQRDWQMDRAQKRDRKNCLAHLPDEDTFIGLFCLLFFITVICRKKRWSWCHSSRWSGCHSSRWSGCHSSRWSGCHSSRWSGCHASTINNTYHKCFTKLSNRLPAKLLLFVSSVFGWLHLLSTFCWNPTQWARFLVLGFRISVFVVSRHVCAGSPLSLLEFWLLGPGTASLKYTKTWEILLVFWFRNPTWFGGFVAGGTTRRHAGQRRPHLHPWCASCPPTTWSYAASAAWTCAAAWDLWDNTRDRSKTQSNTRQVKHVGQPRHQRQVKKTAKHETGQACGTTLTPETGHKPSQTPETGQKPSQTKETGQKPSHTPDRSKTQSHTRDMSNMWDNPDRHQRQVKNPVIYKTGQKPRHQTGQTCRTTQSDTRDKSKTLTPETGQTCGTTQSDRSNMWDNPIRHQRQVKNPVRH